MRRYGDNNRMGIEGGAAIVTGAATGIGRGTAQLFAREGAKVVVADKDEKYGAETVRLIKEAGGEAAYVACDVSVEQQVEALVEETVRLYGSLDFAFNNAGIGPDGVRIPILPIAESSADSWLAHLDVNLTGVFFCLKYQMRQMMQQKKGAIVICSSLQAIRPVPGFAGYGSTKTGLLGLTKVAALEGGASNVRVNCICPGFTEHTALSDNFLASFEGAREAIISGIPLGRLATPEDMAETVLWLCSDAASFLTGLVVPVDGGMSLK
ncbi:MAG: SDR family oxidoreductase [Thermoleophilia bacterium]|nr:SDR family oxidoreductase [Thermoleophilia bacterium]